MTLKDDFLKFGDDLVDDTMLPCYLHLLLALLISLYLSPTNLSKETTWIALRKTHDVAVHPGTPGMLRSLSTRAT
jgi:hypothetical protein